MNATGMVFCVKTGILLVSVEFKCGPSNWFSPCVPRAPFEKPYVTGGTCLHLALPTTEGLAPVQSYFQEDWNVSLQRCHVVVMPQHVSVSHMTGSQMMSLVPLKQLYHWSPTGIDLILCTIFSTSAAVVHTDCKRAAVKYLLWKIRAFVMVSNHSGHGVEMRF